MAKTKKKSYNPFKMWGSYVGAVLSLFVPLYFCLIDCEWFFGFQILTGLRNLGFSNSLTAIFIVILMTIGFLIGWGIHSLFRRFSK